MHPSSSPSSNILYIYERLGDKWLADRQRASFPESRWLDRFAQLAAPGSRILDLGCGAGAPVARYLIERGFAVTGIDGSAKMIERCRAWCPEGDWRVVDMRTLSLAQQFHGIIAWDSFFHLARADQRHMFPLFREHSRAGAPLLFNSGPRDGEAIGDLYGEPLYHSSLAPAEYRALLAHNGYEVRAHVAEDAECGGRTVWLAQRGG
jgi:SAM-dependent methyltransferase